MSNQSCYSNASSSSIHAEWERLRVQNHYDSRTLFCALHSVRWQMRSWASLCFAASVMLHKLEPIVGSESFQRWEQGRKTTLQNGGISNKRKHVASFHFLHQMQTFWTFQNFQMPRLHREPSCWARAAVIEAEWISDHWIRGLSDTIFALRAPVLPDAGHCFTQVMLPIPRSFTSFSAYSVILAGFLSLFLPIFVSGSYGVATESKQASRRAAARTSEPKSVKATSERCWSTEQFSSTLWNQRLI